MITTLVISVISAISPAASSSRKLHCSSPFLFFTSPVRVSVVLVLWSPGYNFSTAEVVVVVCGGGLKLVGFLVRLVVLKST